MSCGTKLEGRFYSYWERQELADKLDSESYSLAYKVRHGECLDSRELRQAERVLDEQGLNKHFDFRESRCHCSTDEEY